MTFQAFIEGYGGSKSYIKFSSNEQNEPWSLTHAVYYFSQGDLPEGVFMYGPSYPGRDGDGGFISIRTMGVGLWIGAPRIRLHRMFGLSFAKQ
jgi:hypothetical protein